MTHRLSATIAATLLVPLSACVDSKGQPPPPLRTKIGTAGGALVVGNGELSLTVPPGALRTEVVISVVTASAAVMPGWIAAGTPYTFAPDALEFALPSQFVIPYDPRLVSPIVDTSEVRVAFRNATGRVTLLMPTVVDSATVWFDSDALGTYWVAAPDLIAPISLFPLNDADEYHFDSEMVLTVERTDAEPNLAGFDVRKVLFTRGEHSSGIYLDVSQGPLAKLGEFVTDEWQEIHAAPIELLRDRDVVGTTRPQTSTYDGHLPFGEPTVAYQGIATTTTSIEGHERITTPAGVFETIRVSIVMDFANTWPEQGRRVVEFWFAPSIGPVAVRFDDAPTPELIESGTVRGRPIAGA